MRWPRLGFGMAWSRMDLPAGVFASKLNSGEFTMADFDVATINDPSALNHLGTNLSFEMPIDVFGKVGTMAGAVTAHGDAASAGTRDAAQEVRLRVVEAYRQAEMAGRALDVMERVVDVAKVREGEIQARVDTGAALQADLLRARARRREREAELAERRGQRRMAQAGLARLLGGPAGVDYVPTEGPPAVALSRARGRVGCAGAAAEAGARGGPSQDRRRLGLRQEREERPPARPRCLRPGLGQPDPGGRRQAVLAAGASLRWTPFDPSAASGRPRPRPRERAALLDARAATDQVRLEVATAYRRAVSARERHAAASGGSEEGREAFRVVQERRKAGIATLTDELETENGRAGRGPAGDRGRRGGGHCGRAPRRAAGRTDDGALVQRRS